MAESKISNAAAMRFVNALAGRDSSIFTQVYVGLSGNKPDADGGGTSEPAPSAGYARAVIGDDNVKKMGAAIKNVVNGTVESENTAVIYFTEVLSSWGVMNWLTFWTSPTVGGGVYLGCAQLEKPLDAGVNTIPLIRIPGTVEIEGVKNKGLKITMK